MLDPSRSGARRNGRGFVDGERFANGPLRGRESDLVDRTVQQQGVGVVEGSRVSSLIGPIVGVSKLWLVQRSQQLVWLKFTGTNQRVVIAVTMLARTDTVQWI